MKAYKNPGIAIISFAHLHQYKWVETFLREEGVHISGIWDENTERGRQAAELYGLPFFDDLDYLLSLEETKGAAICSEPSRHYDLIDCCCRHRIHIMCEKPLAPSVEAGMQIREKVKSAGVSFYQSFPQRLIPSNIRIKKLLESGVIGKVNHIRKRHGHHYGLMSLEDDMPWITNADTEGGGAYLDEGIHETDLLQYFFGMPESVCAQMLPHERWTAEKAGAALYRFPDKALAVHEAAWNWQAGGPTTEIYGDKGTIIQNKTDCASNRGKSYWPELTLFTSDTMEWKEIHCPFDFSEVHSLPPKEFIRILRSGVEPVSSLDDGIRAQKMIRAAYLSAQTGKHIEIT